MSVRLTSHWKSLNLVFGNHYQTLENLAICLTSVWIGSHSCSFEVRLLYVTLGQRKKHAESV